MGKSFLLTTTTTLLLISQLLLLSSSISIINIQEIEVGKGPKGIFAIEDNKSQVFVALSGEDAIAVVDIDEDSNALKNVTKWIVEGTPYDIVSDMKGNTLLVSQNSLSYLSTIVISNGRTIDSTSVPGGPTYLSREQRSDVAYFTSSDTNIFETFDMINFSVIRSYRTGLRPVSSSVSRLGRVAYISNNGEDSVSAIDLLNGLDVVIPITSGAKPMGCILTPRNDFLLVTASGLGSLLFINTTSLTVQRSLAVGYEPTFVDVTEDGSFAFVSNYADGTVSVVDLNEQSVIDTISVGKNPSVVRVFGNKMYVSNEQSGTITIANIVI